MENVNELYTNSQMKNQKFIYLIDTGHGGLINDVYVTPGKRSPVWPNGTQYFEGVGNRLIAKELTKLMDQAGMAYHMVTVGNKDTDLDDRVDVINAMCRMYGADNCILISIHSDGFTTPDAHGWTVYTTKGTTKSDAVATIMSQEAKKTFNGPHEYFREDKTDGDPDKEANFYIIANSKCRAILTENFFHTNPRECQEVLMTEEGRKKIAQFHMNAIKRMEVEL